MIGVIARHELRRMFFSPAAWVVLAVVLFILALLFLLLTDTYLGVIQPRLAGQEGAPGVTDAIISPLLLWAGVVMLAVAPLLTMRAFAEEQQRGSLTLLTSAPLSMTQIVLGKYLGQLLFVLIMLALLSMMPLSLSLGTTLDWGKLAAGMLGLFLLLASFIAAGVYISSLTATPMIAAVGGFGLLLFLVVLYMAGNAEATESVVFRYLSHFSHFLPFLEGIVSTRGIAYYLLFIITFLVFTVRRLDNLRLQR